jgi:hypothetical protein
MTGSVIDFYALVRRGVTFKYFCTISTPLRSFHSCVRQQDQDPYAHQNEAPVLATGAFISPLNAERPLICPRCRCRRRRCSSSLPFSPSWSQLVRRVSWMDATRVLRDACACICNRSHSLASPPVVSFAADLPLSLADTGSRALAESHDDLGAAAREAKADAAWEDAARNPSTGLRKESATATKVISAPERSTNEARHADGNDGRQRRLAVFASTDGAPSPNGNPTCGKCDNGCPSKTYTVPGSGGRMVASTCSYIGYDTRIVVYQGTSCASLTCIGEFRREDASYALAVFASWGSDARCAHSHLRTCAMHLIRQQRRRLWSTIHSRLELRDRGDLPHPSHRILEKPFREL